MVEEDDGAIPSPGEPPQFAQGFPCSSRVLLVDFADEFTKGVHNYEQVPELPPTLLQKPRQPLLQVVHCRGDFLFVSGNEGNLQVILPDTQLPGN